MSKYRSDNEEQAAIFKALSNPHRLALFQRLMSCCAPGTSCSTEQALRVGELGEGLEIAPSTLSHHLKELNHAGLVAMERRGKAIYCRVVPEVVAELAQLFAPSEQPQESYHE